MAEPRSDATPERELDALASIYRFVLDCGEARRVQEKKEAEGRLPSPDDRDGTKIKEISAGGRIIRD